MESSFTKVKMHIEADQRQAEGMCVALQGKESPEGPCYFRETSALVSPFVANHGGQQVRNHFTQRRCDSEVLA